MKFAAIADIHGNLLAFESVLADIAAQGITDIVNLGDHVSGPLEARQTADMLMTSEILSIRGDQDRILAEIDPQGPAASRMDYRQFDRRHLDWLGRLPETYVYRDDVFLCHGSPRDDACYWLDRVASDGTIVQNSLAAIEVEAAGITASLILCAHTHIPRVARLSDGRLAVNPGSIGCPGYRLDKPVPHTVATGTPDACYAILERRGGAWQVTFRYVPYDHQAMARQARKNGLNNWAQALETGWIS